MAPQKTPATPGEAAPVPSQSLMTVGQWLLAVFVIAFFLWIVAAMFGGIVNDDRARSDAAAGCANPVEVLEAPSGPWDRGESLGCASFGVEKPLDTVRII